jgi:anthranilate synthase component 2
MKKILVIDNYDSFTFNLVHYLEDLGAEVTVFRNDTFDLEEILPFDKIVLSPGPGIPNEAGLLKEVIATYAATKSILGICLGHQAIAEVFGGSIRNLDTVYHGVATPIEITIQDEKLYKGIPNKIDVGRYHSWVVNSEDVPETLEITSTDQQGHIMSLRHKTLDVRGVQFHPESILTPNGKKILENWVNS